MGNIDYLCTVIKKRYRNMWREVERRIYVTDSVLEHEYEYLHGGKKNVKTVKCSYYKPSKNKITDVRSPMTLREAYEFARYRMNDGRYKNYEILIDDNLY